MKKTIFLVFLLIISSGLWAQTEKSEQYKTSTNWIVLDSMDLAVSSLIPIGRFSDYSSFGLGGLYAINLELFQLPLNWVISLGSNYEFDKSPYIDTLIHINILLKVGYTFAETGNFLFSTAGAIGMLGHIATGNLNTLENIDTLFFIDQYYGIDLETAFRFNKKDGKKGPFSIFLTPGLYMFPETEYWGFQLSVNLGGRFHFI